MVQVEKRVCNSWCFREDAFIQLKSISLPEIACRWRAL